MAGCRLMAFSAALVLAAWIFSWDGRNRGPPHVSHDGALYFSHDKLQIMHSKEEIVAIVKRAHGHKTRIRVLGSGHSWSPLATTDGIYISLYNYHGLISHDLSKKQVTVRGGTTLVEINSLLSDLGLALSNLPSVSGQTIAGAIVTGTHGTGIKFGNLASFVTSFELVTGTGEVVRASLEHNTDIFYAGLISVGLFGVITEVTLQCEDAFNLREVLEPLSIEQCLKEMHTTVKRSEHVKYWIEYHSDTCAVFSVNRTTEKPRDNPMRLYWDFRLCLFEFVLWILSMFPPVTPVTMSALVGSGTVFPGHVRVDRSSRVFNIPHRVSGHPEAEIAIDAKDCVEGVKMLLQLIKDEGIPVNHITEVRFVKSDNIWLSADYQRDSCHITQLLYTPREEVKKKYFRAFHDKMEHFNGRPHWAKEFDVTISQMTRLYPKLEDFLDMRRKLDPAGIFVNEFLNQQLQLNY